MKFTRRVVLFPFLALSLAWPLGADVPKGALRGEALPDAPPATVGLDELVQISLPPTARFTRGLEIEVQIPREALPYRSNLAVVLYQNFSPAKGKDAATGEKFAMEVLPPTAKFYLQAPLVAKAGFKASVDTAVLKLPQLERAFPLALAIVALAEVPADLLKLQFQVRTRLMNNNLGALSVLTPGLTPEDRRRLRLLANGATQASEGLLLLEPGLYTLEATLPGFSPVTANVAVAVAKVTEVTLALELESPTVMFEAPEGSLISLDGKKVAWAPGVGYPIEAGTHSVQVSLGNTLVTQSFEVTGGGVYHVGLKLQIVVDTE